MNCITTGRLTTLAAALALSLPVAVSAQIKVGVTVAATGPAASLGIPAICLFPFTDPALKTEGCEEAWNPDNLANRAIRAVKAAVRAYSLDQCKALAAKAIKCSTPAEVRALVPVDEG